MCIFSTSQVFLTLFFWKWCPIDRLEPNALPLGWEYGDWSSSTVTDPESGQSEFLVPFFKLELQKAQLVVELHVWILEVVNGPIPLTIWVTPLTSQGGTPSCLRQSGRNQIIGTWPGGKGWEKNLDNVGDSRPSCSQGSTEITSIPLNLLSIPFLPLFKISHCSFNKFPFVFSKLKFVCRKYLTEPGNKTSY